MSKEKLQKQEWSVETMSLTQTIRELEKTGQYLCQYNNDNFGQGVCSRACVLLKSLKKGNKEFADELLKRTAAILKLHNKIWELKELLERVKETFEPIETISTLKAIHKSLKMSRFSENQKKITAKVMRYYEKKNIELYNDIIKSLNGDKEGK